MAISDHLIDELLSDYEKSEDLLGEDGILKDLTKRLLERALEGEMPSHLGYEKNEASAGKKRNNTRNGHSQKKLKGDFAQVELKVPRDRKSEFDPQIIRKGRLVSPG